MANLHCPASYQHTVQMSGSGSKISMRSDPQHVVFDIQQVVNESNYCIFVQRIAYSIDFTMYIRVKSKLCIFNMQTDLVSGVLAPWW